MPKFRVPRAVYDVVAVLDITGSMNTRDQHLDGAAVSRIAMEKRAMHRLLAKLPCGSRLGLAVFVEKQPFLLFEPIETCENFSAIDAEIEAVNWRMGWDTESHIADTLLASIRMVDALGADLIFMTDGQETPPLWWTGMPSFDRARGTARGIIEGVGGHILTPIPRFDQHGREIGVFRPGDVPVERDGMFRGREYMSAVDEDHLRALASLSGLTYRHLDDADALYPALQASAKPRVQATYSDFRWIAAAASLALLLAAMLPGRQA
jgi:mxaL protein